MQREHIVLPLEEDSKPASAYWHNQLARLGRLTGDAKEPTLFVRLWAPDAEGVPLPTILKRGRTAMSEGGWDPSALQRWHDKRQKVESSAVAGTESSAVADNGCMRRWPSGLKISGCFLSRGFAGEGG